VALREITPAQAAILATLGDSLALFWVEATVGDSFMIHAHSVSLRLARR
jgi:hypothetical protein